MRRRSGAVHCQTYQDLINILDHKTPQILHYPDIQSLLLEQQLVSPTQHTPENYYFSDREQFQAEEEAALAETPESTSPQLFRATQLVFICHQMAPIQQQLLSPAYVQDTYSSIYKNIASEEASPAVEVNNHIVRVDRRSITLSSDSDSDFQEHEVNDSGDQQIHSNTKLHSLSPPISEMNHFNLQLGPLYQHKIWLIPNQQSTFSPILQPYLRKAEYVYQAYMLDNQIRLSLLKQGKNNQFKPSSTEQPNELQAFQAVLALLQNKGEPNRNI